MGVNGIDQAKEQHKQKKRGQDIALLGTKSTPSLAAKDKSGTLSHVNF